MSDQEQTPDGPSQATVTGAWVDRLTGVADFLRRRIEGDYEVDPDGFDPELNRAVLMPLARGLYRSWFRVKIRGLEHVPDKLEKR